MSFETEPLVKRTGSCEVNGFMDQQHVLRAQHPYSTTGGRPFYPPARGAEDHVIQMGDLVFRDKSTTTSDPRMAVFSAFSGSGAEEQAKYGDDPKMAQLAIQEKTDFVGICVSTSDPRLEGDQGFNVAVAGTAVVGLKPGVRYAPGQILRAELCDNNESYATTGKLLPDGKPLGKYPAFAVPEDYNTPGENLLTHMSNLLSDDSKWLSIMQGSGQHQVDKWMASARALSDDGINKGLEMIYVLMKMGFLVSTAPTNATFDPYSRTRGVNAGGITDSMLPRDFVTRFAELLGVQDSSDIDPRTASYFSAVRRRISLTQYYDGKYRNYEFAQGDYNGENPVYCNSRRTSNGSVDTTDKNGLFLHNQLNSTRAAVSAYSQAIDEHNKYRVGRYMDGSHKRKRAKIVIEKGVVA